MKTIRFSYKNVIPNESKLAICLGYFDGVHLGHQKLIEFASNHSNIPLGILTFDNPVSSYIDNGKSKEVLTSLSDRFKAIERFNIDYYYVLEIDHDFLSMKPEEFVNLLKSMNVTEIYAGTDFRFGYERTGDISLLEKNFTVHAIDLLNVDNMKVSTQSIITCIKNGNMKKASELLGRNYMISGTVVHGDGIGHSLGFATANIKPSTNYVYPKFGVYKTIAYINGLPSMSLTNVGIVPTLKDLDTPLIEVHLLNNNADIYDAKIDLEFVEFIRPEMKFSSKEELIEQIQKDIESVTK